MAGNKRQRLSYGQAAFQMPLWRLIYIRIHINTFFILSPTYEQTQNQQGSENNCLSPQLNSAV